MWCSTEIPNESSRSNRSTMAERRSKRVSNKGAACCSKKGLRLKLGIATGQVSFPNPRAVADPGLLDGIILQSILEFVQCPEQAELICINMKMQGCSAQTMRRRHSAYGCSPMTVKLNRE